MKLAKEALPPFHPFVSFPEKITLLLLNICFREASHTGERGQPFIILGTRQAASGEGMKTFQRKVGV